MKCGNVRKLLSDHLDDELPANVKVQVDEHLAACPDCANEHARLAMLLEDLSRMGGAAAPWDFWPDVRKRVEVAALRQRLWPRFVLIVRRPLVAIPAIATAAAIAALVTWTILPPGTARVARTDRAYYADYARAYSHYRSQQLLADPDVMAAAVEIADSSMQEDVGE